MTTTTERYTAEQMEQLADGLDVHHGQVSETSIALRHSATRLQSLEAENARLLGLVLSAESIFQHCNVTDGMCGCGEDMEKHSNPMDCGHSPIDHGSYVVSQWLERAYIARNTLKED